MFFAVLIPSPQLTSYWRRSSSLFFPCYPLQKTVWKFNAITIPRQFRGLAQNVAFARYCGIINKFSELHGGREPLNEFTRKWNWSQIGWFLRSLVVPVWWVMDKLKIIECMFICDRRDCTEDRFKDTDLLYAHSFHQSALMWDIGP